MDDFKHLQAQAANVNKPLKKRGEWDETIRTVIYAVIIAVVFRSLFFEPFHIPSGSMKSNLLIGDYLFVSKMSYGYSRYSFPYGVELFEGRTGNDLPDRGDVAVFRLPTNPRIDYIKRVIGLPGDRIQIRGGQLYINGKQTGREYVDNYIDNDGIESHDKLMKRYRETLPNGVSYNILRESDYGEANNTQIYIVPDEHYFMMGDNRDNSTDSRFLDHVGYVPVENFVGRAELILVSSGGTAPFYKLWEWLPNIRTSRFFEWIE